MLTSINLQAHLATGPWYPGTQHGSTIMLMAAIAAEQLPSEVPCQITRLTVEMMIAAPLVPLDLKTELRKDRHNLLDGHPFYSINPDTTINLHHHPDCECIGIQTHADYSDLGAETVMGQILMR